MARVALHVRESVGREPRRRVGARVGEVGADDVVERAVVSLAQQARPRAASSASAVDAKRGATRGTSNLLFTSLTGPVGLPRYGLAAARLTAR